jgi:hypothetical protein
MEGSLSTPNDEGVESYQMLETLVPSACRDDRGPEQTALAALVTRVLVGSGWRRDEAEPLAQGLDVKDLWAILRGPPQRAAALAQEAAAAREAAPGPRSEEVPAS